MVKICVDAGHGGNDSGAVGSGRLEKDYTLAFALGVGANLQAYNGVEVIYTRTSDVDVSLEERANISNNNNCDYFLAIHINSGGGTGLETYYYYNSEKGKSFASAIQNSLVTNGLATSDRGIKSAGFYVLKYTVAIASLVELGFIDNASDMEFLDKHKDSIIKQITLAVVDHLGIGNGGIVTPEPPPVVEVTISELQEEINKQGFGNLVVDNIAGPKTLAAAPTVRQGAKGNITKWIQKKLISLGYSLNYGADGIFGQETKQAVMQFQKDNNLIADGIVGKNTWRKLLGL
ncbi:N-acetylmuramoyl-L-alanine amidase [Clostridium amylolyticum]|uniref:N-acetylmuramoyl-L-alanine amidase n=1 Tax=Clostridium amylolyticum TaxID=1121298 RepID=A0A1M6I4E4_9CLOT|nr:N-acetylmuramoyl-L-alanine amidase [Clostridium amylolyticum]SHJ29318.1 N-acetylmuramoyl-L-alanine amidase [Clostridium amylolyticum]